MSGRGARASMCVGRLPVAEALVHDTQQSSRERLRVVVEEVPPQLIDRHGDHEGRRAVLLGLRGRAERECSREKAESNRRARAHAELRFLVVPNPDHLAPSRRRKHPDLRWQAPRPTPKLTSNLRPGA